MLFPSNEAFQGRSPFAAKSKRAGTGKSRLTPVPTPAEDAPKPEQFSDGEPAEDSDYDTDLEYEQPREEYDPTGEGEVDSTEIKSKMIGLD